MTDFLPGDLARLRYDDAADNQEIVGQVVRVTTRPQDHSPFWMDVEREGRAYSVRGADCARISQVVAGIDEVGRGALAGELVIGVAAFRVDGPWSPGSSCPIPNVKDSKAYRASRSQTVEERRADVARAILAYPALRAASAGVVTPQEIDEHGMTWAMREGIDRALEGLNNAGRRVYPDHLLLDGNERVENWSGFQQSMPKADALWWPVSAASVLAKVYRDGLMVAADSVHSGYGFAAHKGYGTEIHINAIRKKGPCPIHRKSFLKSIV